MACKKLAKLGGTITILKIKAGIAQNNAILLAQTNLYGSNYLELIFHIYSYYRVVV